MLPSLTRPRLLAGSSAALHRHSTVVRSRLLPPRCTATDDDLTDWEKFFDSDDVGVPEDLTGIVDAKETAVATPKVNGACYGCGIALQVEWPSALGYVDPEVYWGKRQHKQQNTLLCTRYACSRNAL